MTYLFTSESVSAGHPDKLCDIISDSILDECLKIDVDARVAVETMVKGTKNNSHIIIFGEVTLDSKTEINYEGIARKVAIEVGYDNHEIGMDASDSVGCKVQVIVTRQSNEISQGVDKGKGLFHEQGAGDQGIMFGFATDESESFDSLKGSFMPLSAIISQNLTLKISESMKNGILKWARPDAKSQVTIEYDDHGLPLYIDTVVIAIQHSDLANELFEGSIEDEWEYINEEVKEKIIFKVIPKNLIKETTKFIINGTGRFVKGGPYSDAGLTGRKIIVDTYGGMGRHGGGAFSGKDPTKVDRSAAYAARWAAKHVVASGLAKRCEIQLSYAIGVAEPVSVNVTTLGTGIIEDSEITRRVSKIFDFRPLAIIEKLKLKKPIYKMTAVGGHFGRLPSHSGHFTWEIIDPELILQILKKD